MESAAAEQVAVISAGLAYQSGFGNEHSSQAVPGALPVGRNSPQRAAFNLVAEQLSGTAFTVPRAGNRRTWMYRMRPSAMHSAYRRIDDAHWRAAPDGAGPPTPNRLRWNPQPMPVAPTDFVQGIMTMGVGGNVADLNGFAIHIYAANQDMDRRYLCNADGEMLVVPQSGSLAIFTELGRLSVAPGEICVIPRGIKFKVDLPDGQARGYICENYGHAFRLPDLGPIGSNGLANPRDFLAPVAAFEDLQVQVELVMRFQGTTWVTGLDHSPLDVVAWHGNHVPFKYDLANFNVIGSVSFDHPDPSIFTVLTSPSDSPGTANADFVIFPPRWLVAEDTFRPPWFHRNVMNEFMGLVHGQYDAKATGFVPGGASLHNCMSAHGPDAATFERASNVALAPHQVTDTMAFMFETRLVIRATPFALDSTTLQADYDDCWSGFRRGFVPDQV